MRKRQRQHQIHISLNHDTGNFYMTVDNDEPMPICNRCLYKVMNYTAGHNPDPGNTTGVFSNICLHCAELMTVENKVNKARTKNK